MSSAVAELENYLQSMLALKPPGVSGSKINSINTLCTANVQVCSTSDYHEGLHEETNNPPQNESVLIQKIYTHFKKAPGTHKLGVLYVVDSVTRQWVEAARKAGQPPGSAATDGTFAAGVNRVTELLPVLMTDIINNAPQDQKVRIYAEHPMQRDTRDLQVGTLGATCDGCANPNPGLWRCIFTPLAVTVASLFW